MLFQHQKRIIETAPNKWGIWHDCGLGKSLTALMLIKKHKPDGVLIITTKSLKLNWQNEINKWLPDLNGYRIMSKEEFKKELRSIMRYECIVADEFHVFGNYKSQLHKALGWYIYEHQPRYIWGLTATPMLSSVMSVWSLSKLLGMPLGSFISFQKKYFSSVQMGSRIIPVQRTGIQEEVAEDLRKIGDVVSKEGALDLPEFTHEFEYFELTKEQKKAIKQLDNDPLALTPIVYNTKALQISNGTLKMEDGEYVEIKSEKMSRVVELAEQYKNCVIVARQTAELEILQSKIPRSRIYNGSTPIEEREQIIKDVNNGIAVMLLQADMGIGFNLTGVSLMIFYSHSWDFVKYYQCLGRIHRIGQKNRCTYIHLLTKDSIDEAVWNCLEKKESFDVALYRRDK